MEESVEITSGRKSLPVLAHSGKVEQLREEFARAAGAGPSSGYVPHVNRTRPAGELSQQQKMIEEKVINALKSVYDPEIPVDIYELGLVYDIDIDAENRVHVRMTLTAPGCPVAGTLPVMVQNKIADIADVKDAEVELVWDPPWNREMMSEAARLMLGM